jgi:hypothetical protein
MRHGDTLASTDGMSPHLCSLIGANQMTLLWSCRWFTEGASYKYYAPLEQA